VVTEPAGESHLASPIEAADLIPDRALRPGDPDEFNYAPLADRVAELCNFAETPVNIALFSPWGSGKSSLYTLIEQRLLELGGKSRLIRYDAWRYGGDGLRRNFIAHTARELQMPRDDPSYSDFNRGLYENQRRVSLTLPGVWSALRKAHLWPLIALAVMLAAVGAILGVDSVLIGALISTFLLLITALVDAGKVEIEQSKPSEDEEFFSRFTSLVEWATDESAASEGARVRYTQRWDRFLQRAALSLGLYRLQMWWSETVDARPFKLPKPRRLVFFIDELDRCNRSDIVKTLKALRTFLDADRCVFIVAADRRVIEQALRDVEQSTPSEPEAPYYSSAGAYIDKIFQHQLALPPLRGSRLTTFAGQLVEKQIERSGEERGFWFAIQDLDGGEVLEDVLYALIPSQVRSPRRVKVLLNNFVLTAKLAEARGVYLPLRAAEVAKLVALRTEFPDFAAALFRERRLGSYWIGFATPPDHRREQVQLLIDQLRNAKGPATYIDNGEDGVSHTPQELIERHFEELRRYLQRTAEIDDPGLDLLYLEAPGKMFGLESELGERIERDAPDIPVELLEELSGEADTTKRGAALLLADMIHRLRGPERSRVMSVLMGLAEQLDPLGSVARPIANVLNTYRLAEDLDEDHLVGALRVALAVQTSPNSSGELVRRLFADPRLLGSAGRVRSVATMADRLSPAQIQTLRTAIADHVVLEPSVLTDPLESVAEKTAQALIDSDEIWQRIQVAEATQGPEVITNVFTRIQLAALGDRPRPELAFAIQGHLVDLEMGLAYQVVHQFADQVLTSAIDDARVRLRVLEAWRQAPPDHWEEWSERFRG
jgi:hypothetical protein